MKHFPNQVKEGHSRWTHFKEMEEKRRKEEEKEKQRFRKGIF